MNPHIRITSHTKILRYTTDRGLHRAKPGQQGEAFTAAPGAICKRPDLAVCELSIRNAWAQVQGRSAAG